MKPTGVVKENFVSADYKEAMEIFLWKARVLGKMMNFIILVVQTICTTEKNLAEMNKKKHEAEIRETDSNSEITVGMVD